MTNRLAGLFFVCLCALGGAGCTGTAPDPAGRDDGRPATAPSRAAPDSARSTRTRSGAPLRAAYVRGDYDDVVRRARERLRDSLSTPAFLRTQTLLGRAEQARGRHEAAIDAFRAARTAAFEADRPLVGIDRSLGESYAALYRWPSAASAFRRVLEARPDDRATRQALAEVYRRSRQWAEARRQYTRLVRRDSTNGTWWARLANCEVQLGEIGAAIPHFARAHELLPQSADIALTLSRYYRATLRMDEARGVVDTTLTHRPSDPRLWRRRADLAYEQDRFDRARRAYEQAIATGDSSATPYRRVGMIAVREQRYRDALSALRESVQKDSSHTRTTLYLGIAYLRLDSLQRAATYLQRTIDEEAKGPITEALIQTGTVNSRRGDVEAAVDAYRLALRLRPARTDVYFQLATTYDEYYREKETAARYYHRFLRTSDSTRARLRTYARERLQALRTTLHMQEGPSLSDSIPEE
jgi:tetratricopeptide (TPR) repeat protein